MAWDPMQGSPLLIPKTQGWSQQWNPQELGVISQNPIQAANLRAIQTGGAMPTLQDFYGPNAVAPNYAAQAGNPYFQANYSPNFKTTDAPYYSSLPQALNFGPAAAPQTPNTAGGTPRVIGSNAPTTIPSTRTTAPTGWRNAQPNPASTQIAGSTVGTRPSAAAPSTLASALSSGEGARTPTNPYSSVPAGQSMAVRGGGVADLFTDNRGVDDSGARFDQTWADLTGQDYSGLGGLQFNSNAPAGEAPYTPVNTANGYPSGYGLGVADWLINQLAPNTGREYWNYQGFNQPLQNFFTQNPLGGQTSPYTYFQNTQADMASQPMWQQFTDWQNQLGANGNNYWGNQANQLGNLAANGLPQTGTLQNSIPSLTGMGSSLLGNQGGYGVQQLLQQIMQSGLPNQQAMTNLTGGQATTGQNLQGQAATMGQNLTGGAVQSQTGDFLSQQLAAGGLSPEYVSALRNLILAPQQEALAGQNNQMGGGIASPNSGLFQELSRRNEQTFNDQLVKAAYENQNQLIGQGMTYGGQQFGQGLQQAGLMGGLSQNALQNALQGFTGVAGAAQPYVQQAGNLGMQGYGMGNDIYGTTNQLGLNALNTTQNLAMQPYNTYLNAANQGMSQYNQLFNTLMGGQLGYGNQALDAYIKQLSLLGNLANTGLQGDIGLQQQEIANQGQQNAAKSTAYGQGVGTAIGAGARAVNTIFNPPTRDVSWTNWPSRPGGY